MSNSILSSKPSWNPKDVYEKVNKEITNDWPDWKKKAYNESFAISAHASKISVKE